MAFLEKSTPRTSSGSKRVIPTDARHRRPSSGRSRAGRGNQPRHGRSQIPSVVYDLLGLGAAQVRPRQVRLLEERHRQVDLLERGAAQVAVHGPGAVGRADLPQQSLALVR